VPRKLGRQIEAAARDGAHFAVIIGDEIEHGEVQLRDIKAGTQQTVSTVDLAARLARSAQTHRHG
jgi:histidyl-tRNA synthetase